MRATQCAMFHHLTRLSSYSTGNPELIRDSIHVWARKWIFSRTQTIQVLKSGTFYSSHKSSLMTCISISSESLSFSCYFISANFRDLELVHSLHSLHPNKFIPGPLLHSLHPKKHSGPAAAQSAPKSLHSLHPKKTFRARCCTVCTQKNSFPARCCTVCTQKKPFPARCCTVCTQSLHSLHRDPKMK